MRQVIYNLLSNAVSSLLGTGASMSSVPAERRGAGLGHGHRPGLAPEDHERIFEEFQQTDVGVDQREGTGLGLALSKRLVKLHGGRIWVDSEPGHGSRSCLRCRAGRSPAMAGERVLVAEDNEKNMKLFRDVLQATVYSTLEATTGEDAVELALSQEPALVLMDIQLPGIDGMEALARLRRDERTASIPVLGADSRGYERRPRAVPRGRVRRLPLQADRRRRADPGRSGALRSWLNGRPRSLSSTTCRRTCVCSRQSWSRAATRS